MSISFLPTILLDFFIMEKLENIRTSLEALEATTITTFLFGGNCEENSSGINIDSFDFVDLANFVSEDFILEEIFSISNSIEEYFGKIAVSEKAKKLVLKRILGGFYVAESKFTQSREEYSKLIKTRDTDKINDLLTNLEIEKKVICRVGEKASELSKKIPNAIDNPKIFFSTLYRDFIIPLTKVVEVDYLLERRLDS